MESEKSKLSQDIAVSKPKQVENRALTQEPRYEPAAVIPLKRETSLLSWLESGGRLLPREKVEERRATNDASEEDIADLIDGDDKDYDDDDDNATIDD